MKLDMKVGVFGILLLAACFLGGINVGTTQEMPLPESVQYGILIGRKQAEMRGFISKANGIQAEINQLSEKLAAALIKEKRILPAAELDIPEAKEQPKMPVEVDDNAEVGETS